MLIVSPTDFIEVVKLESAPLNFSNVNYRLTKRSDKITRSYAIKDDNNFFKKFLTKKINLKCEINEIKFYKINKDKHDFIFSIKDY